MRTFGFGFELVKPEGADVAATDGSDQQTENGWLILLWAEDF